MSIKVPQIIKLENIITKAQVKLLRKNTFGVAVSASMNVYILPI